MSMMSHEQGVKLTLLKLAEFYKEELTENQLLMYTEDLLDLTPEQLVEAFRRYRRDPKNTRFPLPTMLRAMIDGKTEDPRSIGTEVAHLIYRALGLHGSNWPQGYFGGEKGNYFEGFRGREKRVFDNWRDAVLWEIGELGWEVIQRIGWKSLCEDDSDKGIVIAQIRDLAERLYRKAENGDLSAPPSLPMGQSVPMLESPYRANAALSDGRSESGIKTLGSLVSGLLKKIPEGESQT